MKWKDDKKRLLDVTVNSFEFKYVLNQTREICLAAVKRNPDNIKFVINQTEELCQLAVGHKGDTIKFIKNPSEEICILAVKKSEHSISFIRRPISKETYVKLHLMNLKEKNTQILLERLRLINNI